MNEQEKMDKTRRNLVVGASVAGGAAGVAAAVPFVASMLPSERARAVIRRTPEMIESLKGSEARLTDPSSKSSEQPKYAQNEYRSAKPDLMVMEGVCTHLGCSPQLKSAEAKAEMGADWKGGFYCPCHGSKFDYAGRVFRGAPAPLNLKVPPYTLVSEGTLVIGEDKESKA
jgi:ubiquinol-cytochrome c reductase iron-sulfur subunit